MIGIPSSVDHLTPEYFTRCLRQSGVLSLGSVTSVDVRLNTDLRGVIAQVAFARLDYDDKQPGQRTDLPTQLVVKFPPSDPELRKRLGSTGLYSNEAAFYLHAAEKISLRSPKCYFAEVDEPSSEAVMFLEDLSDATAGDRKNGLSLDVTKKVVSELAGCHGTWLNSPKLSEFDYLQRSDTGRLPVTDFYVESWPRVKASDSWEIDVDILAYGDNLIRVIESEPDYFQPTALSFRHGDAHPHNMFFRDTGDETEIIYLDWQVVSIGDPVLDFVTVLIGSLDPGVMAGAYPDLRDTYRDAVNKTANAPLSDHSFSTGLRSALAIAFMRRISIGDQLATDPELSEILWARTCQAIRVMN